MMRSRIPLRLVLGAAVLLLVSNGVLAQQPFPLVTSPRATTLPLDRDVVAQQEVTVGDWSVLNDDRSLALRLDLALGLSVTTSRVAARTETTPWVGTIAGVPDGSVLLYLTGETVRGTIVGPFGTFRLQKRGSVYLAQELSSASDDFERNRFSIVPFLDNTEVFWTVQKEPGDNLSYYLKADRRTFPYYLEADISPHLVFTQNFTDILDVSKQQQRGVKGLKEFAYSFSGTPGVRLRMLIEESAPIRTPSFMPRGNLQILWVRGLKDCPDENQRNPNNCRNTGSAGPGSSVVKAITSLSTVSVWEVHGGIGHHSNGQDGCVSNAQEKDAITDLCSPEITSVTAQTINRVDGTFQTNFVRAGMNYSHHWMAPGILMQASRELRFKVEFEHHRRASMEAAIADLYGRSRINGLASFAVRGKGWCRKRLEGSVLATWNPGVVEGTDKGDVGVQASCYPTLSGGWGIFARYYVGQDYYNVRFFDNLARLQFGMTFNQSDFLRFRRGTR